MVQWDKDSCADAGFLKIDLLGLGMLSAVERCVTRSRARAASGSTCRGSRTTTARSTARSRRPRPPACSRSSRARRCRCSSGRGRSRSTTSPCRWRSCGRGRSSAGPCTVHRAQEGAARGSELPVPYEHPSLEPVLRDTLGAIVFQDQVIEVAMAFAGFSAGEAEGLRRAMSRRARGGHPRLRARVHRGRKERGAALEVAERVYADRRLLRVRLPQGPLGRVRCSPTSPPGCGCTTARSSCARC